MASSSPVELVARAIPLPASKNPTSVDALAAQLDANLSLGKEKKKPVEEKEGMMKAKKQHREEATMSPADHLTLQSLRSSALARKTNTTAKFSRDCRNLFADLMAGGGEEGEGKTKKEKEEKKPEEEGKKEEGAEEETKTKKKDEEEEGKTEEKGKKDEEEEKKKEGKGESEGKKEPELLARGPIRAPMGGRTGSTFHPYSSTTGFCPATAPQSAVYDQSSYNPMASAGYGYLNSGYECGLPSNWSCGRDSVLSSPSTTPDTTLMMSPGGRSEQSELPDDLSDFILEYSRRYSPTLSRKHSLGSDGDADSPRSALSEEDTLASGDSPLCAPQSSPAAPRAGGMANGARTPPYNDGTVTPKELLRSAAGGEERARPAKERLRALIRGEDMDDAWAWTCKCIQRHPGALNFQDGDGDTLLHIVTAHLDLAKIYALVEQMLKSADDQQQKQHHQSLPFDVPNRMGETPLMVAVQKRQAEVVGYLLEAGASPNIQSSRLERDTPLHYAASRGMTPIVSILCAHPKTALNAENGMGLSPLLSAFKSHGVLEEESQSAVCTMEAARVLIKAGADVRVADATNGRTLVHYAVEKMEPRLVELLRENVEEHELTELVNRADFCGETPMRTLEGMEKGGDARGAQMCLALITCGAATQ